MPLRKRVEGDLIEDWTVRLEHGVDLKELSSWRQTSWPGDSRQNFGSDVSSRLGQAGHESGPTASADDTTIGTVRVAFFAA
jgi:hypothetical protein